MISASEGNTPLMPEELADLIPNLATKQELNEWERENIIRARRWALSRRTTPSHIVSDSYTRQLHRKMFDQTWKWAGQYRRTERNLGVLSRDIREHLATLFGDANYWIDHSIYPPDEIAVRFHHRMVSIHPFPNGNGRHARLAADVLIIKLGRPSFTWGAAKSPATLADPGTARARYLEALRAADDRDIAPLLKFARE